MELLGLFFMFSYVASAVAFPKPLSEEEERKCIEELLKGSVSARNKLIEHNLRLVAHVVKKYSTAGKDNEDYISVGTIGLIKAIVSFNAEKGNVLWQRILKKREARLLTIIRTSLSIL